MKRRIHIFLIAAGVATGFAAGAMLRHLSVFPFRGTARRDGNGPGQPGLPGRWRELRVAPPPAADAKLQRRIRELQSIGYAAGSSRPPAGQGVTIYRQNEAFEGVNLVVSGHAPEAALLDMRGVALHRWSCDVFRAWPEFDPASYFTRGKEDMHALWRRAHLLPGGGLLAIFDGIGLIRLDCESRLVWASRNGAHHDMHVAADGRIYVLTREARIVERFNPAEPILEDFICILDAQGQLLRKVSVLSLLENSPFAPLLARVERSGDIFHSNTIELIEAVPADRELPFGRGMLLISILHLDLVCAVDLQRETVVWAESDLWRRQHQPTLLADGNMLVFNNEAAPGVSAVLEFDPASGERRWHYRGTEAAPFYTPTCGSCQRLPNGNTLITESDAGRAFEVRPDGEIVWEYLNPHRAGENDEFVATLFEVVRLAPDAGAGWRD